MSIIMSVWSLRHSLFDHYLCWKDTVPFLMGLQTVWVHFIYNYLIPKVVSVLLPNTNAMYRAPLRQFIHDGMFNSRCQRPHLITWIASRTVDLIHSLSQDISKIYQQNSAGEGSCYTTFDSLDIAIYLTSTTSRLCLKTVDLEWWDEFPLSG